MFADAGDAPAATDAPQTHFKLLDVTSDGQRFAVEGMEVVKGLDGKWQ